MYSGKIAFAQPTYRESLRDIGACPRARNSRLYHRGIRARGHRGRVSRNTLANANEKRDWRIHADFAEAPIAIARRLYAQDSFGVELGGAVYALDSTTIDLCLAGFPRAPFMRSKAAVTLHTPLDLRGNIPRFIDITHRRWNDVRVLDEPIPEAGAFTVMDRGKSFQKRASLRPLS